MARRSGLGKGLGALIPTEVANEGTSALLEVPVTSVTPNNFQPRRHFDEETLASLAASVTGQYMTNPSASSSLTSWMSGVSDMPRVIRAASASAFETP